MDDSLFVAKLASPPDLFPNLKIGGPHFFKDDSCGSLNAYNLLINVSTNLSLHRPQIVLPGHRLALKNVNDEVLRKRRLTMSSTLKGVMGIMVVAEEI